MHGVCARACVRAQALTAGDGEYVYICVWCVREGGLCVYTIHVTGTINLKQLTAWMVVNHAEQILKLNPDQVALCVHAHV